ncbi:MAG: TonB-dependent receptor [bacterium]
MPARRSRGFTAGPTVGLPPGVSVFLDGVRQNEPDAQEVNFDLLPMEHIERVELLSGSASLLGQNSMGGAINLVSAHGSGPLSGEMELSVGSFGQLAGEARTSGSTEHGTDYYLGAGYERERGWRVATGSRNYNAFANLGRTDARRGLSFQAYGARSRAETAGSLPESIFAASPRTNFTAGDFEDLNAEQLAVSGYAPVGRGRGGLTVFLRRSGAERFNVNQSPDPNVRSRTTNLTVGTTADWRAARAVGPGSLAIRVGVDAGANRVRVRIYAEPSMRANEPPRDTLSELTTDVRSPSVDVASYALADYRVGRLTLSGGGRYEFVRVPFRNQLRTADDTRSDFRSLSPRLGASLEITSAASIYASLGRSFRAPAILELGCADPDASCPLPFALGDDPPLSPVRATTYEIGGQLAGRTWLATASAYRTNVRDELFFVASDDALLSGYFTNLDRTRRDGVELSMRGAFGAERLTWYANYSFTRATFQSLATLFSIRSDSTFAASALAGGNDVQVGDRLPLVPGYQVKAGAFVPLDGGIAVGVDARYTGRQRMRGDEANVTSPLGAYTLISARLSADRGKWNVAGVVTNLFDSHDATFGTFNVTRESGRLERFLTPLAGRSLRLILRRELGGRVDATR